ncbi:MAG: peptidase E, partial [Chitinophagales bacterium]
MTPIIAAIGGGSMAEGATASIDREIVRLAGKKNPVALFIPTASGDDPVYVENFQKIYGKKLGCKTQSLLLLKHPPSPGEVKKMISNADIIYVGGGNTLMMMRRWRFLGVDKLLMKASKDGKVMAGTSAGAICWFQYGHSDSEFYYHPDNWEWIRVKCLGIAPFTACPHCLKEGRLSHFIKMIKKHGGTGIALDDCTAMEIKGNQFRILRSKEDAQAFRIDRINGQMITTPFAVSDKFRELGIRN